MAALSVALCFLAACGSEPSPQMAVRTGPDDAASTDSATGTDDAGTGGATLTDEASADVLLYVSNQSFEDDPVRITVHLDGELLLEEDFAVEGQHNWVLFPLDLDPGDHHLRATSDTGVTMEETFSLPEGERRWTVLDYWYYPDGSDGSDGTPRQFTFSVHDEAIGFA